MHLCALQCFCALRCICALQNRSSHHKSKLSSDYMNTLSVSLRQQISKEFQCLGSFSVVVMGALEWGWWRTLKTASKKQFQKSPSSPTFQNPTPSSSPRWGGSHNKVIPLWKVADYTPSFFVGKVSQFNTYWRPVSTMYPSRMSRIPVFEFSNWS